MTGPNPNQVGFDVGLTEGNRRDSIDIRRLIRKAMDVASNAVKRTGDTMTGNLDMGGNDVLGANNVSASNLLGLSAVQAKIRFSGSTGPLGIEQVGDGTEVAPESAFYYRTNPDEWSFEWSGVTSLAIGETDVRVNGTSIVPTAWTGADFRNSWGNYGGAFQAVQYRKEGDVVRIRGLARNDGTVVAGYAIMILPPGFRPPANIMQPAQANRVGGFGTDHDLQIRVNMDTDGGVRVNGTVDSGASWVSCEFAFSVTA